MERKLRKVYYDPKYPASYASIQKLAKATGLRKKNVVSWLKKQATYTLHRNARKRFPKRQYIVHYIDEQSQTDLAEVQYIASKNEGYRYILTVIDIFSRFAWARPLKSKRGEYVGAAFRDSFREGRVSKRVKSDQGREFENRHVRALFHEHNIELFSAKSTYKAAIVERFNRTLKHRLWRYFTSEK